MFRRKKDEDDIGFEYYQVNEGFDEEDFLDLDDNDEEKPRKKKVKQKQKKSKKKSNDNDEDYADEVEYELGEFELSEEERLQREKKQFMRKVRNISILVLYLLFFVLGTLSTTYSPDGTPQVIDVALRENRAEYKKAKLHYDKQLSVVYEVAKLDDTLSNSETSESFMYAVQYGNFQEVIQEYVKEVQGKGYTADYTFLQDINVVVYDNINQYVTLMSQGLSSQNKIQLDQAMSYRKKYETAFGKYTDNIKQFQNLVGLDKE